MSFTEWIFLFGAIGAAGPVLAHLLARPKFQRVPFTMLQFLRSGQIESRSRRRIKDILILLIRCLIVVLIAIMFARPRMLLNAASGNSQKVCYIGLDNSLSMSYTDGTGSLLERMKESVSDYIGSLDSDSVINICELATGQWIRGLTIDESVHAVERINISSYTAGFDDFVSVVRADAKGKYSDAEISVAVSSDFTSAVSQCFDKISEPVRVDSFEVFPIIPGVPAVNLAVTDAHVASVRNGKLKIEATVVNYGQAVQTRQLYAKTRAIKSKPLEVSLAAGQKQVVTLVLESGSNENMLIVPIEVELVEGDGIEGDDKYYLAASVNSGMGHNVLLAGNSYDETFLLKTAFETLSGMDMYENASLKQVDYNDLSGIDIGQYDIIMFSSIGKVLEGVADDLESFVQTGGRIVFFLTGECDSTAVKALWAKDILPALPGERLSKSTHIQAFSTSSAVSSSIGSDDPISQSLLNYEMDRVQVSDYYKLDCHSQGECLWALESGDGFVCSKELGKGKTVIVNTSVDDSAGTLMKSNACLAFCAFLLGNEAKVEEYSFRLDERVRIPASDMELRNADRTDFQVYNCDGQMSTVRVSDSFLVLNDVHGTGWVKTLTSPTRWAGVNLCAGETDMTALTMDQIENAAGNAFVAGFDEKIQMDKSSADFRYKPLWKYFAWVLVVLLLLEITAANTMKR